MFGHCGAWQFCCLFSITPTSNHSPRAYLGVDIFFVISGFLITGLTNAQLEQSRFSFRKFCYRRAKRLLLAAYFVTALTTIAAPFFYWAQACGTFATVAWTQSGYFNPAAAIAAASAVRLGVDRDYVNRMADYGIQGAEGPGAPSLFPGKGVAGRGNSAKRRKALVARCVKGVIEEKLFARRRDLFTDLSLVFMDTTSLSFYRAGGETLGKLEHSSKDFRPDPAQMILALVVDAEGRPICTEMVPGNTADVTVLLPVVHRLRTRFGVTRACVVADRGMISADAIAALEKVRGPANARAA